MLSKRKLRAKKSRKHSLINRTRLGVEPLEDRRLLAIVVDSIADLALADVEDQQITLREAIQAANFGPYGDVTAAMLNPSGADTIQFNLSPGSVISLTQGHLGIFGSLTIIGDGSEQLTIDAQGTGGIFSISNGLTPHEVSISGLTLMNGDAGTNGFGGGINSSGNLALEDVTITNCTAGGGGGIYLTASGTQGSAITDVVSITNCRIEGNTSLGGGGGIYARIEGGTVTITQSIFENNHSGEHGGSIFVYLVSSFGEDQLGEFVLRESTVSHSTAANYGGGLSVVMANAPLEEDPVTGLVLVEKCWIHHNEAYESGGGVDINTDLDAPAGSEIVVSVKDTTISSNKVTLAPMPIGPEDGEHNRGGGGLTLLIGPTSLGQTLHEIVNCTISGNSAANGGGLLVKGPVSVRHSTIVFNTAGGEFARPEFQNGGGGVLIGYAGNVNRELDGDPGLEVDMPGFLPSFSHCIIARNEHLDETGVSETLNFSPNLALNIIGGGGGGGSSSWFDADPAASSYNGKDHVRDLLLDYTIMDNTAGPLAENIVNAHPDSELLIVDPHDSNSGIPDPLISGPIDNGGYVLPNGMSIPTHALPCLSEAVDAGDDGLTAGTGPTPLYDQRGYARIHDVLKEPNEPGTIDIGAFEFGPEDLPSLSADFNGDGRVDGEDLERWRENFGKGAGSQSEGDANGDGKIDRLDLMVWSVEFGFGVGDPEDTLNPDFNNDDVVDGSDFLIWQRNIGATTASHGDGDADGDGDVDATDFFIWQREIGRFIPADCVLWIDNIHVLDELLDEADGGPLGGPIMVSTLADENDGDYSLGDLSLREAIYIASQISGDDEIVFADQVRGSIHVSTELAIASNVTITGPGVDLLTIDASAGDTDLMTHGNGIRALSVASGSTVTIKGLTITGGDKSGDGGGVLTAGVLTLDNVVVSGNHATADGGGVYLDSTGTISIVSSTIDGNGAGDGGGGLYAEAKDGFSVLIDRSTISNNESQAGGGLYLYSVATTSSAISTIKSSTISGNNALSGGGATIENSASAKSNVRFVNATIADNEATGNSSIGVAGGIHNVNVTNTVSGNTDAIYLRNSILAENSSLNTAFDEGAGSLGGDSASPSNDNLIAVSYAGIGIAHSTNGNLVGVAAGIAPLADNGGPTKTHALLPTSQAIDSSDPLTALSYGTNSFDQRGRRRYSFVDVGAVERGLVVSTTVDESDGNYAHGDLSLREALALAAASGLNRQIEFDASIWGQTITLASALGDLSITGHAEILGPGADQMTIHAYDPTPSTNNFDGSRVFVVNNGVNALIRGVTITGGDASGGGGGIYNFGNLTLDGVSLVGNATNSAGGGVWVDTTGTLVVKNSTIDGNYAGTVGGGIGGFFKTGQSLTISDSTISNNEAGTGGGLKIQSAGAAMVGRITNSTFSGNEAESGGAIIVQNFATCMTDLTIVNSTITDNHATGASPGGVAGGIYNINLSNAESGGVVDAVTLFNTIVADNVSEHTVYHEGWGSLNGVTAKRSANNLIGFTYSNLGIANGTERNLVGTASPIDPLLGALDDNGGLTKTHALLAYSPAIDAGVNEYADEFGLHFDQRAEPRLRDGNLDGLLIADIGAYESDADEFFASLGA